MCQDYHAAFFQAGLDLTEMYLRLVFSFLVGNSDMHLKNFRCLKPMKAAASISCLRHTTLLPVNVIMPEDREDLALTMNGKKRNIRRKDFLVFADSCGIERKPAERMLHQLISLQSRLVRCIRYLCCRKCSKEIFGSIGAKGKMPSGRGRSITATAATEGDAEAQRGRSDRPLCGMKRTGSPMKGNIRSASDDE